MAQLPDPPPTPSSSSLSITYTEFAVAVLVLASLGTALYLRLAHLLADSVNRFASSIGGPMLPGF